MTAIADQRHSREFTARWRDMLARLFGYRRVGEYLEVPSLLGRATLSYLPLLSYTDVDAAALADLRQQAGERPYLIRMLAPDHTEPAEGEPVTLRIGLAGRSEDDVWRKSLKSRTRSRVGRAQQSGLTCRIGRQREIVDDFYGVYAGTMHRLGSPALPRELFGRVIESFDSRVVVVSRGERPVAGLLTVQDGALMWVPWIGSDARYWELFPNHMLYWETLRMALQAGVQLLDFGRSPYGGTHYQFKRQWGAEPVAIRLYRDRPGDLYTRYGPVQSLWRRLPRPLVDRLGPRLVRWLADY